MTPTTPRLFHGGCPGLHRGDLIVPGHARNSHPGDTVRSVEDFASIRILTMPDTRREDG
jgi:hypothetical protein